MTAGFPAGPGVKSSPSHVKDKGLIPSWGTKIPHIQGQLSLHTATKIQHNPINKYFQKRKKRSMTKKYRKGNVNSFFIFISKILM